MYRSLGIAVIALAAIILPAETSHGRAGGGGPIARVASAPVNSGGTATPAVKNCRPKAGRRASATACTAYPAWAGAISAILPATATDWSRRSRVRGSRCGKERGW